MKRLSFLILVLAILLSCTACGDSGSQNGTLSTNENDDAPGAPVVSLETSCTDTYPVTSAQTDFVQFTMVGGATFVVQLHPEYAPETVKNFKKLVSEGFYDGLSFHRIVEDSMIQGGDPNGNGTGSSDERIYGEFALNGFTQNTLKHERGVISMIRSSSNDSASCQFCILLSDKPTMDGVYAAFGHVVAGMETVDTIAELDVIAQPLSGEMTKPKQAPVIQTATFVEYSVQ